VTNADYTALLFIVDRSGSMASIAADMEGGIKTLLDEQRQLPGRLTVDFVRFDDKYEHVSRLADPDKVVIKITRAAPPRCWTRSAARSPSSARRWPRCPRRSGPAR
jgi:hypothetical protein